MGDLFLFAACCVISLALNQLSIVDLQKKFGNKEMLIS